MVQHQLTRTDEGYYCEVCLWRWKGKPRSECPGCRRYASRYNIPSDLRRQLKTLLDFKSKNLKPAAPPSVCIQLTNPTRWEFLYPSAVETQVDNPDLPPIIGSYPKTWVRTSALRWYNRVVGDAQPKGCQWDLTRNDWEFLYELSECAIADPTLPPIHDYWNKPSGLLTEKELAKRGLEPRGAKPRAGTWLPGATKPTFYYDPSDCKVLEKAPDRYITKGTLKSKYLLSEGWIKRLGRPDILAENPHYRRAAPMRLYLRSRVENFLAEHAEKYCQWLDRREGMIELAKVNFAKFRTDQVSRKQQTKLCLQCASGVATAHGFVCAVHPLEWPAGVPNEQLCPDWNERKYEEIGDR